MTSSRLDRLFVLLESGSSPVTRSAAAKQLGEVQRLHPHELVTLLTRTADYLRSSSWDTRIAAGEAIRAIVSNVPQWNPIALSAKLEEESGMQSLSNVGRLQFAHFDLNRVLTNSYHLMSSEGKEFDADDGSTIGVDSKEKLAKQRQLLNARLGLDMAEKMNINISGLFTNEDLLAASSDNASDGLQMHKSHKARVNEHLRRSLLQANAFSRDFQKPLRDVMSESKRTLSSRERNRAKRMARQVVNKQRAQAGEEAVVATLEEPDRKKGKVDAVDELHTEEGSSSTEESEDFGEWPLDWFCEQLMQDLFSLNWEYRHGAATALREIITVQGLCAGKTVNQSPLEMDVEHRGWLEDVAIRLLCVLALDRFGDFVSDAVVAPVRETCAQCLAAVLKIMSPAACHLVLDVLLQLLAHQEWETRHGGLLGVKYLFAVRADLIDSLLQFALSHIVRGLSDAADDVAAVAAAALIPIAPKLLELLPDAVPEIVTKLWDLLCEQDELAGACNSFMGLLAAMLSLADIRKHLPPQPLGDVVPRLWPFLSHSASNVRKATLQTMGTLTEGNNMKWEAQLLQDAMRHVYQRVLVEHVGEVRALAEHVWSLLVRNARLLDLLHACCPYMRVWLCLAMQPVRLPFDANVMIWCRARDRRRPDALTIDAPLIAPKYFIGGAETVPLAVRERNAVQVRCTTARMLGLLSCYIVQQAPGVDYSSGEKPVECYVSVLLQHLNSKSALQRMVAGLVIAEWAMLDASFSECPPALRQKLHACLTDCLYYDEIALNFTRLAQETRDFVATMKHYHIHVDGDTSILTLDTIQRIAGERTKAQLSSLKLKPKVFESLCERRRSIFNGVVQTSSDQTSLTISTLAAICGATVCCRCLPDDKLTPVVKPLMESLRREANEELQMVTARRLAHLIEQCIGRTPCPNDKIISNLCTYLKCDPEFTPVVKKTHDEEDGVQRSPNYHGIVTLSNQQRMAEKAAFKRSNATGRGPGRPPTTDVPLETLLRDESDDLLANRIQRRGAMHALIEITKHFGVHLEARVPRLWELIVVQLESAVDVDCFRPASLWGAHADAENLVSILQVLEVTFPHIHPTLRSQLMRICLARLCLLLTHPYCAVRHMASRCLAVFAKIDSVGVMEVVIDKVVPLLAAVDSDINRQGAVEAIACMVDTLQFDIIPYVVLLVVPLLGRMSDQNQSVRLLGTNSFATLVQLMPLDGGVPEPATLKSSLLYAHREREREFLHQLFAPHSIPDCKLQIPINAQLRSYQQAGVNWLAFLNKYKLHGILCDDMGLGKTLQSICILANDHHHRHAMYKSAATTPEFAPLPSLVVCPPTLTGHWVYEVDKFLPKKNLKPVQYHGSPQEREKLRQKLRKYNLVVASYDIIRKDIAFFTSIKWNYVVLDEGHIIKNGKTRTSHAVKKLVCNHRLILSGTPIQNNVLEIWSLFDFLMPGFLGTEKQFTARYSKPILASRDPKCSQKEQEAGALAMEALHRQVLPFLLRRMKEDVLDDLPPKITQDYYCDLSPVQAQLYEDFSKSHAHQTLQQSLSSGATASSMQGNTHIFQALRYLQNVCNHPKLVLTPTHPQFKAITSQLLETQSTLESIHHSAKLPALRQLLWDCGIGEPQTPAQEIVINEHRALIFCQLKAMLDIIENDLFKETMPEVSYLRLDGSIPPGQRHAVVTQFNNDPSIDVLLLTTQVGGLGLNLTGADTVIFVEHDWNPMKDLQAMDRAHRIGQRKVVNVYRLITRGTLEEKIMCLQKFKVQTATTVISSENSSMETMGTDQLLDLFSHKPDSSSQLEADVNVTSRSSSVRAILEELPELWDDKQYEEEYDLTQFISKLSG